MSSKKRKVKRKLPRKLTRSEKRNRANAEAAVKAAIHRAAVPPRNIPLQQKLIARATTDPGFINKINDMPGKPELFRRIIPGPDKRWIRLRARTMAYYTSKDLKRSADTIREAALANDKLFFYYLVEFLKNKPK